jgi:anti-sigma factor RsiW
MIVHDDAFFDQLAVFALGALPEAEARPLAAHVASCPECKAEYARLRETADLIAFAAEPPRGEKLLYTEHSVRMKKRVMQSVRDDVAAKPPPAAGAKRAARRLSWDVIAALAACIALVTACVEAYLLRAQGDGQQIAQLQQQLLYQQRDAAAASFRANELESRVAALLARGSRHFRVANGEVVTSHGHVLLAMHLPPAPFGKVYQAWTLKKGKKTVAPSITFMPGPDGVVLIELPEPAKGLAAVAVSVEPPGGSKAPTSPPIVVRKLS